MTITQLELVARICQEVDYKKGDEIFTEGTPGNSLIIVAQGQVDILVNPNLVGIDSQQTFSPKIVASLLPGQSFGEVTLVDQGLRSASARSAQKNTRLLIIPSNQLRQLCDEFPLFGYRLMSNLAADLSFKLRNADLMIRQSMMTGNRNL